MGGAQFFSYSGVTFDFFHVGALLVVIMAIITGMVLCVAVVGVCCFHWLEDAEERRKNSNASSTSDVSQNSFIRNHIIRFEDIPVPTSTIVPNTITSTRTTSPCAHVRVKISCDSASRIADEPPPPYDILFPPPPGFSEEEGEDEEEHEEENQNQQHHHQQHHHHQQLQAIEVEQIQQGNT